MPENICELCGCESANVSKHHFIPRTTHKNPKTKRDFSKEQLNSVLLVCQPCHCKIHSIFSEKELKLNYNTKEKLLGSDAIKEWLSWRNKHKHMSVIVSRKIND